MADQPEGGKKPVKPNSRDARLKAALRENLLRRKAQARSRAQEAPDRAEEPPPAGRPRSTG